MQKISSPWASCVITWCAGLLLFVLGHAYAGSILVDAPAATHQSAIEQGAAGALRNIGAYPEERGIGHSVTALPDGRVFVYGHYASAKSTDSVILDPKLRSAERNRLVPVMWDPSLHAWRKIENPPECQFLAYLHTATALPDGRILIAGGLCDVPQKRDDNQLHHEHTELSLWNDATRKWETAPSLFDARIYHTATLLADHSVLFAGGESDTRTSDKIEPVLDSVERFHDGKMSRLPHMLFARAKHTATRMADGSVMVVGGMGKDGKAWATAEIWNPAKQIWSVAPSLKTARYGHTASLLSDGRLLVAGGIGPNGEAISSVEMFDPANNEWSDAAPLLVPLQRNSAVVLENDNVLVAGVGVDWDHSYSRIMLWEKATNQWRPAGHLFPDRYKAVHSYVLVPMPLKKSDALVFDSRFVMQWSPANEKTTAYSPYGERDGYSSTLLNDGRIMLAGGRNLLPGRRIGQIGLDWVEIFDPITGLFSVTGRLNGPRRSLSAIALDDGRVVVARREWSSDWDNRKSPLPNFAEAWNPGTGQWGIIKELQSAGAEWAHFEKFGKLRDGRVLFFFSDNADIKYRALIWDPRTGSVETKRVDAKVRILPSIAITPDGLVLIVGGHSRDKMQDVWEPEVWDSRTGNVEKLPYPPDWVNRWTKMLALKNGNVLWMDSTYSKPETASVAIWNAFQRTWRKLPPLPIDKGWDAAILNLNELSDGTIITDTSWLRPGAASWAPVQRFPQTEAMVTQLPSGQLLALSSSPPHVAYFNEDSMQWQLDARYYLQRKENPKPALLELADGRLMVSGSPDLEGVPTETTTQIWNPNKNSWITTGKLSGVYTGMTEAIRLPSGQVMHLGIDRGGNLMCEIGHPGDNFWNACGASMPLVKSRTKFTVGSSPDGRTILMFGQGEAYSYSEQTKQWLAFSGNVSEVERNTPGMGSNAFPLPDGCSISAPPFRIFNPATGKEIRPAVPVTGIKIDTAHMVVLADGTVVLAGYPEGVNGIDSGFFHRKASCAGFEVQDGDSAFMPPVYWTPPQVPVITPVVIPDPSWWPYVSTAMEYKWIALAILFPVLLYRLLRKVVLRMNAADPGLTLPKQVEGATRAIIYGLGALAILYVLWPYGGNFFRFAKIKAATSASPPCRFIGTWSSSRSGSTYRITLTDDGRYATDPIRNGYGITRVYTGYWEVQRDKMVWHHDDGKEGASDINPIRQEGSGTFTLIEENGEHSKFELLEKIDSTRCAP